MQETGTTPVIPSAPELDRAQPNGVFVKDAIYLAIRQSQVGEPAYARAQLKTAGLQRDKIDSATERAYWTDKINETSAFVESNAERAEALRVAAQLSDAEYVGRQKLTPAELVAASRENVDLQRGLDAKASGQEASLAYNGIPNPGNVTAKVVATLNPEGSKAAGIETKPASVADLPSTIRYVIYAGVAAVLLFALGYGAFYYRAARSVA